MSCVYLIRSQGFCKIGIAKDMRSRLSSLQTGSPVPLELIAYYEIEDALQIEQILHNRLHKKREMREWFRLDELDLKHIEELIIARGGRKGDPLLVAIGGSWNNPPIKASSSERPNFPEKVVGKSRRRKHDWYGKYGTSGRPNLNLLVPPTTELIEGRVAHVWWEDSADGPMRCVEFLDE